MKISWILAMLRGVSSFNAPVLSSISRKIFGSFGVSASTKNIIRRGIELNPCGAQSYLDLATGLVCRDDSAT